MFLLLTPQAEHPCQGLPDRPLANDQTPIHPLQSMSTWCQTLFPVASYCSSSQRRSSLTLIRIALPKRLIGIPPTCRCSNMLYTVSSERRSKRAVSRTVSSNTVCLVDSSDRGFSSFLLKSFLLFHAPFKFGQLDLSRVDSAVSGHQIDRNSVLSSRSLQAYLLPIVF